MAIIKVSKSAAGGWVAEAVFYGKYVMRRGSTKESARAHLEAMISVLEENRKLNIEERIV